jgi:23S rRNA (adenine2503-C2)-methyltransferase
MATLIDITSALESIPERAGPAVPPVLLGSTRAELETLCTARAIPAFRGRQLAQWLYRKGARDYDAMTDLPRALREELARAHAIGRSVVATTQTATDGTTKLLLELQDRKRIETVLLPYADRTSVCISSQVGCPVGCVFCATATMGFGRNLTAGEMVDQVLTADEIARERATVPRVTHVVVMGMGEPLLNVGPLVKALHLLHDEVGLSMRHLTVSTAGFVPGMRHLADAGLPVTLALSLHAPTDAGRAELIPMSRRYGLKEVFDAVHYYTEKTGRRVTIEYLLRAGVNDSDADARALARLTRGYLTHVNLIPWNPADSFSRFAAPGTRRIHAFRHVLEQQGLNVTQRAERGREIDAACGQLAVKVDRDASNVKRHPTNTGLTFDL